MVNTYLDFKEIKPVHSKGNQSWIFIGKTDAKAETPILWPPDTKNWLIWKDPVAGKDWGWEEKGMTEDEMVGRHHRVNGHEFEWTLGVGDGQEAWRAAVHGDTKSQTWLSDWTELNWSILCRVCYDSTELLREKGDLLPGCQLSLRGSLHRMSPVLHVFDEPLFWYSTPAAQATFPAFYCYDASGFSSMELLHYELRQLLQCPALAVHDSRQFSASGRFFTTSAN